MANKSIQVTLDAELYAQVSEHAKNKGVTISEVASALVKTGISRLTALSTYAAKTRKEKKAKPAKAPKAAKAKAAGKGQTATKKAATAKPKAAKAPAAAAAKAPTAKPAATANADRLKKLREANNRSQKQLNGVAEAPAAEA